MLNLFRGSLFLLLSFMGVAQAADTGWLSSPQNDHARVRFQAQKQNGHINALLFIDLQPGWKTYWRSPGEGGVAPVINWQDGVQARWYWPVPSRFEVSGLTTQGYHQQVIIPLVINGDKQDILDGTLTLSTCSNVCLLTDYRLHVDFIQPDDADFQQNFSRAMDTIPSEKGITGNVSAYQENGSLVITATRQNGWEKPDLFFDPLEGGFLPGNPTIRSVDKTLKVVVPVTDEWGDTPKSLAGRRLSFVLTNGDKAQQVTLNVGSGQPPSSLKDNAAPEKDRAATYRMIVFAFIGGLILNLMPCVLPVMGMKLNSLLHHQHAPGQTRLRFLATSAGIMTSFALLAAMLTLLRITGSSLGWGIQFQNPWFIGMMVTVTFIFSLNLFGIFELLLPSSVVNRMASAGGNGPIGSFFEGVFATLLATPCSAPFLGTAVAFALGAPLQQLWLIFMVLGLGMSLPWVLVALIPATLKWLPRPGRWMNTLKNLLGVMMLASSLWLASLLSVHLGEGISTALTLLLTAIAMGIMLRASRGCLSAYWLVSIVLAIFAGYQIHTLLLREPRTAAESTDGYIHWQPLSEETLQQSLAEGKRVFVDISADWCVTCKVNEHRVLNQPEIITALNQSDVVALRGDWSKPSELISMFLHQRNSYAIPFNQVYGPSMVKGEILPPLLDKATVLNTLNNAKG